jgi:hypothetical protein
VKCGPGGFLLLSIPFVGKTHGVLDKFAFSTLFGLEPVPFVCI